MGLTKEQWHDKRVNEIIDYVVQHGKKISDNMIYWDTYPVCVKDICVLGVAVKGKVRKKLSFGDFNGKTYTERKTCDQVERKYLEDTLADMKAADKRYKK